LSEKLGESNGFLLYQLEKDIADLYLGSDTVVVCYSKLKKLLDEVAEVRVCGSGANCSQLRKSLKWVKEES